MHSFEKHQLCLKRNLDYRISLWRPLTLVVSIRGSALTLFSSKPVISRYVTYGRYRFAGTEEQCTNNTGGEKTQRTFVAYWEVYNEETVGLVELTWFITWPGDFDISKLLRPLPAPCSPWEREDNQELERGPLISLHKRNGSSQAAPSLTFTVHTHTMPNVLCCSRMYK